MAKQVGQVIALAVTFLMVGCEQNQHQNLIPETTQGESEINSHYEELKSLEWLQGEWKDDEKDVDIVYSTEWSTNRNFLIQHFNSQIDGEADVIEGEQIIGWDPAEKKVRSWIFDSDGGFGQSTWAQDGSSWYSTMKFTMPDGRKASGVMVYTKIDNDSYTFMSMNREVDGEVLPEIGPIKIVRKK